jgi:superfamily II DNA/RNA helicase
MNRGGTGPADLAALLALFDGQAPPHPLAAWGEAPIPASASRSDQQAPPTDSWQGVPTSSSSTAPQGDAARTHNSTEPRGEAGDEFAALRGARALDSSAAQPSCAPPGDERVVCTRGGALALRPGNAGGDGERGGVNRECPPRRASERVVHSLEDILALRPGRAGRSEVRDRPGRDGSERALERDVQSRGDVPAVAPKEGTSPTCAAASDASQSLERRMVPADVGGGAGNAAAASSQPAQSSAVSSLAQSKRAVRPRCGDTPCRRAQYSRETIMSLKTGQASSRCPPGLAGKPYCKHPAPLVRPSAAPAGIGVQPDARKRRDVALSGADRSATFEELRLPTPLLSGLRRAGLHVPSPVQIRGIPLGRLGVDLIAQAKSGTGKTVVFCVLALETVLGLGQGTRSVAVLILVPTRDIAAQIRDVLEELAVDMSPRPVVGLFIGGTSLKADETALREKTPCIAVGTPGRVEDLVSRGAMDLSTLKLLVLDEVDRMLDGSFDGSVPAICGVLPTSKQVATFSATYSPTLLKALDSVMRRPHFVRLCDDVEDSARDGGEGTDGVCPDRSGQGARQSAPVSASGDNHGAVLHLVRQAAMAVTQPFHGARTPGADFDASPPALHKTDALVRVLSEQPFGQAIVFSNDKTGGRIVKSRLCKAGFATVYTSGSETQAVRMASMDAMRRGNARVLVATDLIARGVDLPGCDLVVHLDVPQDSATYLHRVGRAGRFGSLGMSIVLYFGAGTERFAVRHLECELLLRFEDASHLASSEGGSAALRPEGENDEITARRALSAQAGPTDELNEGGGGRLQASPPTVTVDGPGAASGTGSAERTETPFAGDLNCPAGGPGGGLDGFVQLEGATPPIEEFWNDYAERAYGSGWEAGYQMARRVALDLAERLGPQALLAVSRPGEGEGDHRSSTSTP